MLSWMLAGCQYLLKTPKSALCRALQGITDLFFGVLINPCKKLEPAGSGWWEQAMRVRGNRRFGVSRAPPGCALLCFCAKSLLLALLAGRFPLLLFLIK